MPRKSLNSTDEDEEQRIDHDEDTDPWEQLAENRDALKMCVEENVAFSGRAKRLLDRLEEEGY